MPREPKPNVAQTEDSTGMTFNLTHREMLNVLRAVSLAMQCVFPKTAANALDHICTYYFKDKTDSMTPNEFFQEIERYMDVWVIAFDVEEEIMYRGCKLMALLEEKGYIKVLKYPTLDDSFIDAYGQPY